MIEFETPLDRIFSGAIAQPREAVEQRAARIARGDFSDPADRALDRADVRGGFHRRMIGRR